MDETNDIKMIYVESTGETDNSIGPMMLQADLELLAMVALDQFIISQGISNSGIFSQSVIFKAIEDDVKKVMKKCIIDNKIKEKHSCIENYLAKANVLVSAKKTLELKMIEDLRFTNEYGEKGSYYAFRMPESNIIRALLDYFFEIKCEFKNDKFPTIMASVYIMIYETVCQYLKVNNIDFEKLQGGIAIYLKPENMYDDKTIILMDVLDFIINRFELKDLPIDLDSKFVLDKTDIGLKEVLTAREKKSLENIECVAMHAKLNKGKVKFTRDVVIK